MVAVLFAISDTFYGGSLQLKLYWSAVYIAAVLSSGIRAALHVC